MAGSKSPAAPGLVEGHAYTVMGTYVDSGGNEMVVLRNPWGTDTPAPPPPWVGGADDGVFAMPLEDFKQMFGEVQFGMDALAGGTALGTGHFARASAVAETSVGSCFVRGSSRKRAPVSITLRSPSRCSWSLSRSRFAGHPPARGFNGPWSSVIATL